MRAHSTILDVSITFLASLLSTVLYYALLTKALSGSWGAFQKINDIPDMLVFSIIVVSVVFVYLHVQDRSARLMLGAGLALRTGVLMLVITVNRVLSVYPASGVGKWYLVISLLGAIAYILIAVGLARLVTSIYTHL